MESPSRMRARAAIAAIVFGPVLVVLVATGIVGLTTSVDPYFLMSDPAAITDSAFYLGLLTWIAVLAWWSTTVICLFSYAMARRLNPDGREHRALLWAGLLTAVLAIDDMLMVHEHIAPTYLGVQETTVYALYFIMAVALFFRFRRSIFTNDIFLLLTAIFFFGCSQLVDVARGFGYDFYGTGFVEESCKLLGIAGWLAYWAYFSAWHLVGEEARTDSRESAATPDFDRSAREPLANEEDPGGALQSHTPAARRPYSGKAAEN